MVARHREPRDVHYEDARQRFQPLPHPPACNGGKCSSQVRLDLPLSLVDSLSQRRMGVHSSDAWRGNPTRRGCRRGHPASSTAVPIAEGDGDTQLPVPPADRRRGHPASIASSLPTGTPVQRLLRGHPAVTRRNAGRDPTRRQSIDRDMQLNATQAGCPRQDSIAQSPPHGRSGTSSPRQSRPIQANSVLPRPPTRSR